MTHKKAIFLDIDGVIAISTDSESEHMIYDSDGLYPFTKQCVAILNRVLEATDADIVLSSTWRLDFNLEELDRIFRKNGVKKSPVSKTPEIHYDDRNLEIADYLKHNPTEKYVILDDLDIPGFGENFIWTDSGTGLSEAHIPQILKCLKDI